MKLDIGISNIDREKISRKLEVFFADTYTIFLKTQNYHWNMIGENFFSFHILLQKQYEDIFEAIDEIAERIRAIGFPAPATFEKLLELTQIPSDKKPLSQNQMVKNLILSHESIAKEGKSLIHFSQNLKDDVTADMVIKRLAFHEKAAWLLRSHLTEK